jgi:hypothetical protein
VTVTLTAAGSANLQRTAALLVTAVIAATGVNNSTQLGTSSAGVGIVPSSHPNEGLAPFSAPGSASAPSAGSASVSAPTSTGG